MSRNRIDEVLGVAREILREYDTIDMIIDLLYATMIPLVEEYLGEEYDEAYHEYVGSEPDAIDRNVAIYSEVDGKTFADRLMEYSLEEYETRLADLLDSDGHRVCSEGTLAAAGDLQRVGYTVTKTWSGVMDEHERDAHVALEGVTIPCDGYFEIDGYRAKGPGMFGVARLDCHCRCKLTLNIVSA